MNRFVQGILAYFLALAVILSFWYLAGRPCSIAEPAAPEGKRLQSVSYTPFIGDQSPFDFGKGLTITDARLEEDLAILSRRFSGIRTYSTTGLDSLPKIAEKYGMQLLLGAWVSSDAATTGQDLEHLIALAKKYPASIRAVVVGNETLLRREITGSQLAAYIRQVKAALPGVPVTYADVWEFWLRHPEVAEAVDFVTIHILPYWEDEPVGIDAAMAHVKKIRDEVAQKIPGKEILIGETGWPSQGRMRERALPSLENQARFMRGFIALAEREHWQYNLIEAFDQPWKRIKEGAVGGYWGMYTTERQDKNTLAGEVRNLGNWQLLAALSAAIALFALLITPRPARTGRLLQYTLALAAGAVLLVLQGQQFAIISLGITAHIWAGLVLTSAAGVYFLSLRAIAGESRLSYASLDTALDLLRGKAAVNSATLGGLLRLAVVTCALIAASGLFFDGRYRNFLNAGFVIPAIAYLLWGAKEQDRANTGMPEKLTSILLAVAAVGILALETWHNFQAVIWCAICLMLAWPLWREGRQASLRPLLPQALLLLTVYGLLALVRHKIFIAEELVEVCAAAPNTLICQVRTILGKLMYFEVFGWSALGLTLLSLLLNRAVLTMLALFAALASLLFYNAGMGAVAFVLALIALAHGRQRHG
ncbi:glycoside hydrolase family 17 protein [Thiovibrio sp. JS02]